MNFKALTIAREYGSGGAEIARSVANRLGWILVDQALLAKVCNKAKAPFGSVASLEEPVDPWLYRIMRRLWGTGADGYSAVTPPVNLVDGDAVATLTNQVIQEAHLAGRCVIVGRGAQCVLRGKADVFHVFVYADWADRVRRIHIRLGPDIDAAEIIRSMDAGRLDYVRHHYGVNRLDPHLYDLLVKSRNHADETAQLILLAMEIAR